jgi:hypothetical protein
MSKQPNANDYQVPFWVEFFGYVNLAFLLMPVCLVCYAIWGQNLWMQAFGFKVYAREHLALYIALVLLPFVGGLTAIGVLRRRRWGLALGIGFSIAAILMCCSSFVCAAALHSRGEAPVIEIVLLGLFLRWIVATMKGSNRSIRSAQAGAR